MSKFVSLYGFGGFSNSSNNNFNFEVKAYPTEEALLADIPAENTVGVITENEIIGWYLTPSQPEGISEGEVWIRTSISSPFEFNVLNENTLLINPVSCYQFVDGSLVELSAKTYKEEKWNDWVTYLYNKGDEFTDLTGGFVLVNPNNSFSLSRSIKEDGTFVFKGTDTSTYRNGYCYTKNKIDLTNYKRIYFNITRDSYTNAEASHKCVVFTSTSSMSASVKITKNTAGLYSIDISALSGSYHVGLNMNSRAYDETHIIEFDKIYMN